MADEGFGRRLLRAALPGLGQEPTNYQKAPPGATPGMGGFTRNLSDQFRQPEVQAHISNMFGKGGHAQTARKFARAGMGHALLYTMGLADVPNDKDVQRRGREMNRTVRGRDPGHVEVTPDQPPSRDEWIRQSRAKTRNDRLRKAWGEPAPTEEESQERSWVDEQGDTAAQQGRENRGFYRKTVGTPKRRPRDFSDMRRRTP